MKDKKIAVMGATGAVGCEMLRVLNEYGVPCENILPLASGRSEGRKLPYGTAEVTVRKCTDESFNGVDIVLGATDADTARRFAPSIKVSGAVISAVRRFFAAVFAPISRISRKICRKIGSSARRGKKIIRKTDKKTKFILQKYKGIVYNLNSFIKNSVSRNKGSE